MSWTYLQSSLFVRTKETHKIKEQLKPFFLSSSLSYINYLQWIILLIYGMLRAWSIVVAPVEADNSQLVFIC